MNGSTELTVGTDLIPTQAAEEIQSVVAYLESVQEVTVTTDQEHANSVKVLGTLKKDRKALVMRRQELVKPHKTRVKVIENQYLPVVKAVDNMIEKVGDAAGEYQAEKERKRREEQAKRDAEAEEKRRKEEDAARRDLEKAEEYEKQGRPEMAEKAKARATGHLEAADSTVATEVTVPQHEDASFVLSWEAIVEDKARAVKACMENPVLSEFVTLDLKGLERTRKAVKGNLEVPGIRFKEKYGVRSRS